MWFPIRISHHHTLSVLHTLLPIHHRSIVLIVHQYLVMHRIFMIDVHDRIMIHGLVLASLNINRVRTILSQMRQHADGNATG